MLRGFALAFVLTASLALAAGPDEPAATSPTDAPAKVDCPCKAAHHCACPGGHAGCMAGEHDCQAHMKKHAHGKQTGRSPKKPAAKPAP